MGTRGRPKGLPKTGGRRKGTPNRVTASIKSALTEAFDGLGGVPALVEWGKTNPTPFYQCWSRLAPKDAPEASEQPHVSHLLILPAEKLPNVVAARVAENAGLLGAGRPHDYG